MNGCRHNVFDSRTRVSGGVAGRPLAVCAILGLSVLQAPAASRTMPVADTGGWAVTSFAGLGTDGGIQHLPLFQADFVRSCLAGIAVSRRLWQPLEALGLEAEIQAVQHAGKQSNAEFNVLLAVRWRRFPWNDRVFTSLALGEGVSYATGIPAIERERATVYSRLLNYIYYELEVGPPRPSRWSMVSRIHHRSGVYGLYNNASRGSNFVALGLRYHP